MYSTKPRRWGHSRAQYTKDPRVRHFPRFSACMRSSYLMWCNRGVSTLHQHAYNCRSPQEFRITPEMELAHRVCPALHSTLNPRYRIPRTPRGVVHTSTCHPRFFSPSSPNRHDADTSMTESAMSVQLIGTHPDPNWSEWHSSPHAGVPDFLVRALASLGPRAISLTAMAQNWEWTAQILICLRTTNKPTSHAADNTRAC